LIVIFAYIGLAMLSAILALVSFVAMVITKAVAARPELAEIDPFALRLTRKMSTFCFYFCTATTVFMVFIGPLIALAFIPDLQN